MVWAPLECKPIPVCHFLMLMMYHHHHQYTWTHKLAGANMYQRDCLHIFLVNRLLSASDSQYFLSSKYLWRARSKGGLSKRHRPRSTRALCVQVRMFVLLFLNRPISLSVSLCPPQYHWRALWASSDLAWSSFSLALSAMATAQLPKNRRIVRDPLPTPTLPPLALSLSLSFFLFSFLFLLAEIAFNVVRLVSVCVCVLVSLARLRTGMAHPGVAAPFTCHSLDAPERRSGLEGIEFQKRAISWCHRGMLPFARDALVPTELVD